jgi:hypothetical protein
MKHQPFETWLFETADLSLDQYKELEEHLVLCKRCSTLAAAWREVEERIQTTSCATPAPGFSNRWVSRMAHNRRLISQRQINGILLSMSCALVLVSILFGAQLLPLLEPMFPIIVEGFNKIVNIIVHYNLIWEILDVMGGIILEGVPMVFQVILPLAFAGALALWIVSLYRLDYQIERKEK